jgi:putative lipoic acid-binding regulatory protein
MPGDGLPAIDLLESTHEFPGPYVFKMIGRTEDGFAARVVAGIREEMASEADPPFSVRHTAHGGHVCVTVTPVMQTAWQVLGVYRRMRKLSGLVMLW